MEGALFVILFGMDVWLFVKCRHRMYVLNNVF